MIKSLKIENFQSHLNSCLEFSNGINVISGQSNNGKSSILRSLSWVIFNRPLGLSFKSSFSNKKDIVKITINTETDEIVREKNDTINQYKINNIILDTVGSNCPDEIASVLNFSELNIQSQFEKHFLITESAGEVGRTINGFLKLDDIDALISNISSKITSTNKELEIKKQDLDKLNLSLEKFNDYNTNSALVKDLNKMLTRLSMLDVDIKALETDLKHGEPLGEIENNVIKYLATSDVLN